MKKMKVHELDLSYQGADYPDPPGPEKIAKYLESEDWIWDRVWQPKWKTWLFGPRYGWFGPVGTHWFMNDTPKSWEDLFAIMTLKGWSK